MSISSFFVTLVLIFAAQFSVDKGAGYADRGQYSKEYRSFAVAGFAERISSQTRRQYGWQAPQRSQQQHAERL